MTSYKVENLQPKTNYTLYMAAITCHGEGVRSEPYPIIASHYLKLLGRNASEFLVFTPRRVLSSVDPGESEDGIFPPPTTINGKFGGSTHYPPDPTATPQGTKVYNHTWFIACLVGIAVLWLLIFVIVLVCRRQRRQRVKQRYPPDATLNGEDMTFRLKRNGDRNSKMGLLDGSKENGVVVMQQQPILAPVGLMKHNSPRLQMGTGILTSQRTTQQHDDEVGYEAPGMFISTSVGVKLMYPFESQILKPF